MVFQFSSSWLKDANVTITSMCTAAFLHHQLSVVLSSTHADRCSGRKLNSRARAKATAAQRSAMVGAATAPPAGKVGLAGTDYVSLVFTTPRPESARNPIDCLCGLGGRAFETTPAGVNLS